MPPRNPHADRIYDENDDGNNNNNDDDDIILVSSTRERWERLHGIEPRHNKAGIPNDDLEDEILLVAVRPTKTKTNAFRDWKSTIGSFQTQVLTVGIVLVLWRVVRRRKRKQLESSIAKQKDHSQTPEALSTTSKPDSKDIGNENHGGTGERQNMTELDGREETSSQMSISAPKSTTAMIPSYERKNSLVVAQQIAQDIKVFEQVLAANDLDVSMAPQLAINQQLMDHQRELSCTQAMLENHQKSLDRRRSEEMHQERLQSARYDPNWENQLGELRDKAMYWNGGIGRVIWEILLVHLLGILWQRYFRSEEQLDTAMVSIRKDSFARTLGQVCDCDSEPFTEAVVPSSYVILTSLIDRIVPASIACYGYCAMFALALLGFTILCHHFLRILSLPSFLHHVVNLAAAAFFYGPQRILTWAISSYNSNNTNAAITITLSLCVVLPLWSWQRTSWIYKNAVRRIKKATVTEFEALFRDEQSRLEQCHREQMAMRYLLLSVYSALVLWEHYDM